MKSEELFQIVNGAEDKYIEEASEMLALQQEAQEGVVVYAAPKSRRSVLKSVIVSVAATAAVVFGAVFLMRNVGKNGLMLEPASSFDSSDRDGDIGNGNSASESPVSSTGREESAPPTVSSSTASEAESSTNYAAEESSVPVEADGEKVTSGESDVSEPDKDNVTPPAEKPTSPPSTTTNTGSAPSDEHTPSASDKLANKFPRVSEKELKAAIDKFPLSNIILPDGSVVSKYEAISADADVLIFGFAFYRNTSPIFKTTLTDPGLITHENGFWEAAVNVKELDKEIAADYKKAAAGSVLENGLLVDGAMCRIDSSGNITQSEMCLSGSITVPGIINYLPEGDMSGPEGTLYLRSDTTKATLPVPYSSWNAVFQYWDGYKNSEDDPPFYMYFDGLAWNLGNIHDLKYNKFDLKNAFGDAKTIAAAVTVCDLSLSSMYGVHGEIIDIQL